MFPPFLRSFSSKRRLVAAVCICLAVYSLVSLSYHGGSTHFIGRKNERDHMEANSTAAAEEEDVPIANETWVKLRSELLRENRVSKVFLFTYMRGGSSLFAELFNLDPQRSILFFEPLDAFYQSYAALYPNAIPQSLLYGANFEPRSVSEKEITEISDYLESLFACRIDQLPVETFAHNYFRYSKALTRPGECMARKYSKAMVSECIDPIKSICGNDDSIRRNMSTATANKCPEIIRALRATLPDEIHPAAFTNLSRSNDSSYLVNVTSVATLVDGFSKQDEQRLNGFVDYHMCRAKAKFILKNCMDSIEGTCKRARVIALKVIRSRMKDLEMLIQRIPDIHVFYYTRDPRAITNSRVMVPTPLVFSSTDKSALVESKILCHRMWEDIKAKRRLERIYPGSITTIRYEDFVRDLNRTALQVYEGLGYQPSAEFYHWLNVTQTGSSSDGPFGTRRPNATASIDRWKLGVTFQEGLEISRNCLEYLTELGYEAF